MGVIVLNQGKYLNKRYLVGMTLIGIVALTLLMGCTGFALTCEDQSRQKLANCNTDCGEGVLSEFCKSSCTAEHNARLDDCAGK